MKNEEVFERKPRLVGLKIKRNNDLTHVHYEYE